MLNLPRNHQTVVSVAAPFSVPTNPDLVFMFFVLSLRDDIHTKETNTQISSD